MFEAFSVIVSGREGICQNMHWTRVISGFVRWGILWNVTIPLIVANALLLQIVGTDVNSWPMTPSIWDFDGELPFNCLISETWFYNWMTQNFLLKSYLLPGLYFMKLNLLQMQITVLLYFVNKLRVHNITMFIKRTSLLHSLSLEIRSESLQLLSM